MKNLISILVVILLVAWIIGFFVFEAPAIIHLLVFIAITGLIFDVSNKRKQSRKGLPKK